MNKLTQKFLVALIACHPFVSMAQRPTAKVPEWKGIADRVLGKEEDENETFGFVTGLTLLADGRLVVADWNERKVRVFSAIGRYQFDIGREGGGPGEFRKPCCLRALADSTLLIGDPQANRYNRYRVVADRALSIGTLTMRGGVDVNPNAPAPSRLAPNRFARLMALFGDCRKDYEVQEFDSLGAPARTLKIAPPPDDSLDLYVKKSVQPRGGRSCSFYPMPFGSQYLLAFSPKGDYARAIGGRYDIEWRSADGTLKTRVARAGEMQVPFTSDERQRIAQRLGTVRAAYDGPRRVVEPTQRAPITSLLFDEMNRLWVVRGTPLKAPGAADVYEASGKQVARVTWPSGYSLGGGDLVTASAMFVVTSDSSDVTHITRIRFR